ncbi:TANK-binding kinase 1-binding protein 1 [Carlito syrichta]|uniref:TANK-binding kinase 1-binding protein 1 n=1 Tax=Carlito syrichta TaxID=1868482 RepID=A0A3Q0DTA7_CARSF|nr:TANK-binding kinase 1-binding protein 1 [Carlito syrichta]
MESMFEDDLSILTQEALGPSEVWLDGPGDPALGEDMCSASHFALITAYGDIKERLGGLERENATLRRRLKVYEIKYPLISDFGEEHGFSLYEIKDGSLLEVEKVSLQQRLNQFQHELQKNKEQEEQLGEMIQAYEKLCVEKSDLETELGEMRALVETHLRQICGLEQQLRQQQGLRDAAFSSLSPPPAPAPPCAELDLHYLALGGGSGLGHAGWPGPTPSMSELERRRLEEALEAAQGEARGAQLREEQLQAECERLQGELKQLQETRAQDLASNQSERDMAWVKRVGDDQTQAQLFSRCRGLRETRSAVAVLRVPSWVHAALAREEERDGLSWAPTLLRPFSQGERVLPEAASGLFLSFLGLRTLPWASDLCIWSQQFLLPSPRCLGPQALAMNAPVKTDTQIRPDRTAALQPLRGLRLVVGKKCELEREDGNCTEVKGSVGLPWLGTRRPTAVDLQAWGSLRLAEGSAAGVRVAGAAMRSRALGTAVWLVGESEGGSRRQKGSGGARLVESDFLLPPARPGLQPQARSTARCLWSPPRGSVCEEGARSGMVETRVALDREGGKNGSDGTRELSVAGMSSEAGPWIGHWRLNVVTEPLPMRNSQESSDKAAFESCSVGVVLPLLMETVGSDIRSCPLCQLGFPVGYPDDALIKHIDSHLENSKI